MAEVSHLGFQGKTLLEYRDLLLARYRAIDPNWDLTPDSFDGQSIAIMAEVLAILDEQIGLAYDACDPDTAVETQLRNIGRISHVLDGQISASSVELTFEGNENSVVPRGVQVRSTATGTIWETISSITLGVTNTITANCTTLGPIPADVGEITEMVIPLSNVDSVTNKSVALLGDPLESDAAFRNRRNDAVAKPGNNQVDNMKAVLVEVPGLRHVHVFENENDETNELSVLPHSLLIVVDGGEDQPIARAIASKKNPGCGLNRLNDAIPNRRIVATTTPKGNPMTATFFRAAPILIKVIVTLTALVDEKDLPVNFVKTIRDNIILYTSGSIFGENSVDAIGFDNSGYDIGEDVYASQFFTPVNKSIGSFAVIKSLTINDTNYVDITFNQISTFSAGNIKVDIEGGEDEVY